jgi:hypothetical protein
MIFEYYTEICGIVSLKMKQKKGRDSSELFSAQPVNYNGPKMWSYFIPPDILYLMLRNLHILKYF